MRVPFCCVMLSRLSAKHLRQRHQGLFAQSDILYKPNKFIITLCESDGSLKAKKTHPNATK